MSGALATRAPLHLEATVRVLQRRPGNPVNAWDRNRYWRVLPTAQGLALMEVRNAGTIDTPDVRLTVHGAELSRRARAAAEQMLRRMLGLDVDPGPLQAAMESEPALRPTASALRGMRPPRFAGLFETFANVVPFQQVSLDAGTAITGRLIERFGQSLEQGGRRFYAFPAAAAIDEAPLERLRECGLSGRKAETLRGLARTVESGELTEAMLEALPTPEALRLLVELPGIGPWSAALVLLRGLGRLDVFPSGDVGAARVLGALMRLGDEARIEQAVERFGDRRGYVYFYGLGSSLLAKGLIDPAPQIPAYHS